jgi:hypothetical protein
MESIFQQALAHHNAGRLGEAEALYRQASGWKPEWTLGNLGIILRVTGRLEEAEATLRRALAAEPGNAPVRHTLGMTLLQLRRYAEGWALYEARHERLARPTAPFPSWRGESLTGKRILVLAEQGKGDQILWSRFIPRLAERAAEVILAVPRALVRLFGQLPARVIHPGAWDEVRPDVWVSMGSVPRWLEAGPADADWPYLGARPAPASRGVGLMLQGGGLNGNMDRLPGPAVAQAIRGLADFTDLDPAASGARDFAETAEIVAGLEQVVTVDTSVAHLAGALGKPTLILMPRPAIDWYANWDDDRTPWYPSARLIRQRSPGDWAGVLGELASALALPAAPV